MIDERYLVVVSGPSGCGKDTVVTQLIKRRPGVELSVSCTTRAMREGEHEGVDYYYISEDEFRARLQKGRMLEYTEYAGNLYGTPMDEIEQRLAEKKTVVLVIDVRGGESVKAIYPGALLIFIMPPSRQELERRLRARGQDSEETILRRLAGSRGEMEHAPEFDYVVVNRDFDLATEDLLAIIRAQRLRTEAQLAHHHDLLPSLLA